MDRVTLISHEFIALMIYCFPIVSSTLTRNVHMQRVSVCVFFLFCLFLALIVVELVAGMSAVMLTTVL